MASFRAAKTASLTSHALREHLSAARPLPLKLVSLTDAWPSRKWTSHDGFAALRGIVGENRAVDVEIGRRGRGYLDKEWRRVTMGFGLFLDAFVLSRIPSSSADTPIGYLAQSDLADLPILADSFPQLEHFQSGPQGSFFRRTLWVGPAHSFTPFHRDPYIGLYSQVVGRKTFHVLPPEAEKLLDPSDHPLHRNTSRIPLPVSEILAADTPDSTEHAVRNQRSSYRDRLIAVSQLPGACKVSLAPGETVLVPEGWWHAAEGGNEAGVGVGGWFR